MSRDHLAGHEARTLFLQALEETTMPQDNHLNSQSISLHDKLPLELLPVILSHLRYRQGDLAKTSLVCKQWYAESKPLLWEWVRAPRDSERIVRAFSALSKSSELCSYVKELEVRVYPLASQTRLDDLQAQAVEILKHAKNLSTLIWTRKGSLQDKLLDAICSLQQLERLEINATTAGEWRVEQLTRLPHSLKSLTLLLPQREIVSYALPQWLENVANDYTSPGLSNLALVCFQSSVVNSTNIRDIAKSLGSITSFTLHGCNKLSDEDLLFAIKHCGKLQHLSLENVSVSPTFYASAAPQLPNLKSLRTSHPGRKSLHHQQYYQSLEVLVRTCPYFDSLTHYLSGDTARGLHPSVPASFVKSLLDSCGHRLKKFEINGLSLSFDSVRQICFRARSLQQLVIPIGLDDIDDLQFSLLRLHSLRSLHIVAASTDPLRISLQGMLDIVKHCPETLRQIGVQNRVRSVVRESVSQIFILSDEEGDPTMPAYVKDGIKVSLRLWNEPIGIWPEALQVIRT